MAISNTGGGNVQRRTRSGRLTNMEAFDRLPKAAREALANADHNWSAASLYDAHKARKSARFSDASFDLSKARNHAAFIEYSDAAKHRQDAADNRFICGGQR